MVKKKILTLLKSLKIKKKESIMIHGDLSFIGQYENKNIKKNINFFFNSLKKIVGKKGTIICPAFTYSFCKNSFFDYQNSPSEVGLFSELFRKRKDTKRTDHPIFSFSIYPKKNSFNKIDNKTCFGNNSIFHEFHKKNGRIICFGTVPEKSITFFHYIEELAKVKYRKNKIFKGKIKIKNKFLKTETNYYVRKFLKNTDFKMNKSLEKIFQKKTFGRYLIYSVKTKNLTTHCLKKLKKNHKYLIK